MRHKRQKARPDPEWGTYDDALGRIRNLPLKPIFDPNDPNQYLMFFADDGTRNSRDQSLTDIDTNPGELERMVSGSAENVRAFYLPGVGTEYDLGGINSAFGLGVPEQVSTTYDRIVRSTNEIYSNNPDANFVFADAGFSRGATSIRALQNLLVDQGIPDVSSAYETYDGDTRVTKFDRYIVEPGKVNIGASVLFDTVSTGIGSLYNLSVPSQVSNTLHLTARDEDRTLFPLVSAIDRNGSSDSRILEMQLPGAHSDIGGSYDVGGFGHANLKLAYTYLDKLGVPLAPFPSAYEPNPSNFVIHDSRFLRSEPFDQLLNRGVQREVNYVRR